jgi:hypothetical protein
MTERLKSNAEYEKAMSDASPSEMAELNAKLLASQTGVRHDPVSGRFVAVVVPPELEEAARAAAAAANEPTEFTKTTMIAGREVEVSAANEEQWGESVALARQVAEVLTGRPEPTDEETHAAEVVRQTELQLKMQRGEITVQQYLAESGAIKSYLESQGVSLDAVRAHAESAQASSFEAQWARAAREYLDGPGSEGKGAWKGGQQNLAQVQLALEHLGLAESPSVESIEKAVAYMRQNNLEFDPVMDIDAKKLTENMTPQEILMAWREQQPGAQIGDASKANAAFISAFRRR